MAAQAYTPEIDPEDPPRGRQRLLQATILTGRKGAPWEALHTALYWAQVSPNGPDTPEPTEAWVKQAKAMRNYHLHHPFDNSPAALTWPTDPPETVRKLADLTHSHAKATMQKPAEPPLRDPGQQATHPFFQPQAPPAPPPAVPAKRGKRKRGAPAPNQAREAATSQPPAPPPAHPANADQASSSSSLPSLPPPNPDQASSSSSQPSIHSATHNQHTLNTTTTRSSTTRRPHYTTPRHTSHDTPPWTRGEPRTHTNNTGA